MMVAPEKSREKRARGRVSVSRVILSSVTKRENRCGHRARVAFLFAIHTPPASSIDHPPRVPHPRARARPRRLPQPTRAFITRGEDPPPPPSRSRHERTVDLIASDVGNMNHPLLAVHLAHLPLAVLVLPARHAHFIVHANRNRVRAVLRLEFARERRGHELPALARRRGEVRLARFTTGRGDRGRVLHRARRQEADVERSRAQGFRAHRAGERPPPDARPRVRGDESHGVWYS